VFATVTTLGCPNHARTSRRWAPAAAIAIFDATGVRERTMPFTPERARAALA